LAMSVETHAAEQAVPASRSAVVATLATARKVTIPLQYAKDFRGVARHGRSGQTVAQVIFRPAVNRV
jgi:hypothetical protein